MKIYDIDVQFPFAQPYAPQVEVMTGAMQAMCDGGNALLESPTGCGKTMALLCSALAWQEAVRRGQRKDCASTPAGPPAPETFAYSGSHAAAVAEQPSSSSSSSSSSTMPQLELPLQADNSGRTAPLIIYASRTHSQLRQVVGELRRTAYRPRMIVLGSREHTCIHPGVRTLSGAAQRTACHNAIRRTGKVKDPAAPDLAGDDRLCLPSHADRRPLLGAVVRPPGQAPLTLDIEDLVKAGTAHGSCPYLYGREAAGDADTDLLLCSYAYLLDPDVRDAVGLRLDGAIVIIDEAHNVEDVARTAGGSECRLDALDDTLQGLTAFLDALQASDKQTEFSEAARCGATSMLAFCRELREVVCGKLDTPAVRTACERAGASGASAFGEDLFILRGPAIATTFSGGGNSSGGSCGMTLRMCRDALSGEEAVAKYMQARGSGCGDRFTDAHLSLAKSFARTMARAFDERTAADYRFVARVKPASGGFAGGGGNVGRLVDTMLHMWCMNPALEFSALHKARSIVLASGTLAPMDSFASELATPFATVVSTGHVIAMDRQALVRTVALGPASATAAGASAGARDVPLSFTFKSSGQLSTQDALGGVIERACAVTPNGVVVFFASYAQLAKFKQRWTQTGLFARLSKPYYEEASAGARPKRGKRPVTFEQVMSEYAAAARTPRGALLFAVFRGKVSEGIDFADALARCVLLVGIPYASTQSTEIALKKEYNSIMSALGSGGGRDGGGERLLDGQAWYTLQAFRAYNQALGRCLRHIDDYGAILLVDDRFARRENLRKLSGWVQGAATAERSFADTIQALERFFADKPVATTSSNPLSLSLSSSSSSALSIGVPTRKRTLHEMWVNDK